MLARRLRIVGLGIAACVSLVACGGCLSGSGAAEEAAKDPAATHVGIFPVVVETEVAGKPTKLKLTGSAMRKKFGLAFYQVAGYCCETASPPDVDALAAADVPKQLVLVMERDISNSNLETSFDQSFALNDPEGKFINERKTMLDYMTSDDLKEGQRVVLTHVPQTGLICQVADRAPATVNNVPFANMVWNVYMGPLPVTEEVRKGLGTRLAKPATN